MIKTKRIVSLALSALLIFSLFTAFPGARLTSYAWYSDSGSIKQTDAVETLTDIGVLAGYEDNTFRPSKNVTRAEASKIICYILIGTKAADSLSASPSSFTDVTTAYWANPYIEYCVSRGVIAGYGDGRFGPGDNVTAAQMAKMLLVSIGYGARGEYEGQGWMWGTLDKATANGIEILSRTGISDYSRAATREQVAQYTYNALTIPNMVKWNDELGEYIDIGADLMFISFGVGTGKTLAGYVDPEGYASEGWSDKYRNELVNGWYYNSCGYAIKESDYRDMLAKRSRIYADVITSGMDEYDKVQAIHDWICDNITYNYNFYDNQSSWKPTRSSYEYEHQLGWAGLILGTAVCAGYSDAYLFLLDGLGIDCYFIYGPIPGMGGQHAWNIVNVDGANYHVDTTWDDQETYIGYYYFMTSDSTIRSKKGSSDYREWEARKFPSCPADYSFPTISASANNLAYGSVEGSYIGWGKGNSAAVKGTTIYLSAYVRPGYVFENWEVVSGEVKLSSTSSAKTEFAMPNRNVHIRANFKPIVQTSYTITVGVNGAAFGTASSEPQSASPGTGVALSANPEKGYEFDCWEVVSGDVKIGNINSPAAWFVMPDGNVSVRAVFKPAEKASYTVTVDVNDASSGNASSDLKTAAQGDKIFLAAYENEGYEFDHWEVVFGGAEINDIYSPDARFTMQDGNVYIIAHFKSRPNDVIE